jgi:hypothetical protein
VLLGRQRAGRQVCSTQQQRVVTAARSMASSWQQGGWLAHKRLCLSNEPTHYSQA